ncbi:hypothetical protein [Athalassotoga saccharophila]|uniref:hypothetical protein n=1 Tax=Athalassotoga saccharophila TaxID=1441386 RepID=UPI00137B12B4|nr:hypothetical protein [Athalassotoga saccharophila]BBJ28972.1 hypothetical protein ATHSA_1897 [Athalassotoga saccharophila]
MKNIIVLIMIIFTSSVIFANSTITAEECYKSSLSVTSVVEVMPCMEAQTTALSTSVHPVAFDPIIPAMNINTDFLVTLATLNIKLNFQNIFVYVNVNKSNVMSFMSNSDIQSNGQIYNSAYYLNNIYFVVVSTLSKSDHGYYTLNVNVEALNSQVEQWTKGSQYTVPVEFTVLYENIGQFITNYGNTQNIVFNR